MVLKAYHRVDLHRDKVPITEAMVAGWIGAAKLPDRPYYDRGKIVPAIFDLLDQAAAEAAGRKWSPPSSRDPDRIATLRSSGESYRKIADKTGCSISTAKRLFRKSCLRNLISPPLLRRAEVEAMHEAGWTRKEMVDQLGVKDRTIRRILKELGLDKKVI